MRSVTISLIENLCLRDKSETEIMFIFFVTAVSPVLFMDQFSEAKGQVVSNKENDRENIEKSINDMDSIILERE